MNYVLFYSSICIKKGCPDPQRKMLIRSMTEGLKVKTLIFLSHKFTWVTNPLKYFQYLSRYQQIQCCGAGPCFDQLQLKVLFFTGSVSFSYKNRLKSTKKMFLPSHLHTSFGSNQKVLAPAPQHWPNYSNFSESPWELVSLGVTNPRE